jgi:hypothetical protein
MTTFTYHHFRPLTIVEATTALHDYPEAVAADAYARYNELLREDKRYELPDMTPDEARVFAAINRLCIDDCRVIDGVSVWRAANTVFIVGCTRIGRRGAAAVAPAMLEAAREVLRQQQEVAA